jgi:glycosyltransferase involved in cell wall biosynthesis
MASRAGDLVSVVIVAHDDWPHLELAIESALGQSYPHVEVIVVDNDSSDATPRVVPDRYGDWVAYRRQPNRYEGGGRNTGFELASGELIQFLDADDFLAPDKIAKQVATFEADARADIVYGDFRVFGLPGLEYQDGETRDFDDFLLELVSPEGNGAGLLPHSALFRRRALERIGRWDETIPTSDQDYWLRAAVAGCRFRHCPGSLAFYRRRPGQMSSRGFGLLRDMELTFAKALGYVRDEPYRSVLVTRLARLRFVLALAGESGGRRESLAELRRARKGAPETVSGLAYGLGYALILVPGGSSLARAQGLRPARALGGKLLGLDEARAGASRSA